MAALVEVRRKPGKNTGQFSLSMDLAGDVLVLLYLALH